MACTVAQGQTFFLSKPRARLLYCQHRLKVVELEEVASSHSYYLYRNLINITVTLGLMPRLSSLAVPVPLRQAGLPVIGYLQVLVHNAIVSGLLVQGAMLR